MELHRRNRPGYVEEERILPLLLGRDGEARKWQFIHTRFITEIIILLHQGDEFGIHFRFKMREFGKDVIEDFPPLLGPNLVPATSAVQAKYNLIRATEDVGHNLRRYFDIPRQSFLKVAQAHPGPEESTVIQPSLAMIDSDALLHLAKALIKIVGDDQAAFSLWLRSKKQSCNLSHLVFIWPAVFVSFS